MSPPVILMGAPGHPSRDFEGFFSILPSPSRWAFDWKRERLLGDHLSPPFPGWRSMWRASPLGLPLAPLKPELDRPLALVTKGNPAQNWPPKMPVLQNRDHAWSTTVAIRRITTEREALQAPSSATTPPRKWHHHGGPSPQPQPHLLPHPSHSIVPPCTRAVPR